MKRPSVALARLQEISGAFYAGKTSRDEFRSEVIDVIQGWVKCSRISLWRFDGEPGALTLLCVAAKVAGGELTTAETRLVESEYRDCFEALVRSGTYVSVDALTDVNLQPMREPYLLAHGVQSMLDAAFMVNGRAYGMVCCEQTDVIRRWRSGEIAALRAIVAKLALLMASAGDSALWGSPSLRMSAVKLSA